MAKNNAELSLDEKLIAVYREHGVRVFLDVCSKMLDIKDSHNVEKKKTSNGEVCEVVLRVLTMDYLKKKHITGEVFHSMILGDLSNPGSDFKTELDLTVLTPTVCVTAECKSFSGDITVVDDCTLIRRDMRADVARQSKLHGKCLQQQLKRFVLPSAGIAAPPFGLFCFVYCNGTIQDRRTLRAKAAIPVLTISNLYTYYNKLFSQFKKVVYNYDKSAAAFRAYSTSRALHEAHRRFLGY